MLTAQSLREMPDAEVQEALSKMSKKQIEALQKEYKFWARPNQIEPEGDHNVWFLNCGRGFGKTWTGAQWVREKVKEGHRRIACVASTNSDIERVMVKGESGFLALCSKYDKTYKGKELGFPEWSPTKRSLSWANGAKVEFYSAEEPERLRGPQFSAAWCFTKGHMIETQFGKMPVERIQKGSSVYTSEGLRKVSHTSIREMPVGKVTFSDGTTLEGTFDHPIYTQRGWIPLGELEESDTCVRLNTMAAFGVSTHRDTTIQQVKALFTDMLQKKSSETSKGLIYTISTETNSTTAPVIYSPSHDKSTYACITGKEESLNVSQRVSESSSATVAGKVLYVSRNLVKGFIAKVVNTVGRKKKESPIQSVVTAEKVSTPEWELFAVNVASIWQPTGVRNVYNLRVENTHEYFCNGILTHNCDELAAWNKDEDTWDMLQFCLRLGKHPKVCVTTTPKSTKLVRKLLKHPKTTITTGSTFDNAANLADTYLTAVKDQYEGTRLGRQELYAEVLEENEGALWTTGTIDGCQVDRDKVPDLTRVVVALDPAVTANAESDMTGIVVAGVDVNGKAYILGDYTDKLSPQGWASKAIELYHSYEADRIVAEVNQGGDMVKHTIHGEDESVPLKMVRASRGKYARAEPVAALYERGLVHHVRNPEDGDANLNELETQMRTWEPLGSIGSPDRLDAMVWALTELMLNGYQKPQLKLVYSSNKGL